MHPVGELSLLFSPTQTTKVDLHLGEVMLGKVVASFGDKVIVSLCGGNLLAETNLSFFPGDFIKVRVDGLKKGKIILKFLGKGENAQSAKEPLESSSVKPDTLFSIPIQFNDEVRQAQIGIFRQKEGDKFLSLDGSNFRLVLFLDMPNIGPMKILLEVLNKDVNCRMEVENEKMEGYLSGYLKGLTQALERFNYEVNEMAVLTCENKIEPLFNKVSVNIQV